MFTRLLEARERSPLGRIPQRSLIRVVLYLWLIDDTIVLTPQARRAWRTQARAAGQTTAVRRSENVRAIVEQLAHPQPPSSNGAPPSSPSRKASPPVRGGSTGASVVTDAGCRRSPDSGPGERLAAGQRVTRGGHGGGSRIGGTRVRAREGAPRHGSARRVRHSPCSLLSPSGRALRGPAGRCLTRPGGRPEDERCLGVPRLGLKGRALWRQRQGQAGPGR